MSQPKFEHKHNECITCCRIGLMSTDEMKYNYHDSVLIGIQWLPNDTMQLTIQLYEIFYPEKEIIELRFIDINNLTQCKAWAAQLAVDQDEDEPDWHGARFDRLIHDHKRPSTSTSQFIFIEPDGYPPLKLHCRSLVEEPRGFQAK